jgi:hypothetical protein
MRVFRSRWIDCEDSIGSEWIKGAVCRPAWMCIGPGKPFVFSEIGETELRGFAQPVRFHEVKWSD